MALLFLITVLITATAAATTTFTTCNVDPPAQCPWYSSSLSDDERVSALVSNLTISEKISLLNSNSPSVARLHVPKYGWWSEAAHGVAWAGVATVFPCSMGLGATFDAALVQAAGEVISDEARAKHLNHLNSTTGDSATFFGLDFFAPNINIVRDIRWGRAQETYGEDPVLTGTLGAAVIRGMQQYDCTKHRYKTVATAKHFASYNVESNFAVGGTNGQYRLMYDVNVSHADLMQTFFPAFEDAVVKGKAGSLMCSYNRLNSIPMCAHPFLQSIVRDRLQFSGYIVSDEGAIDFMVTQHKWAPNHTVAAAAALNSGVDLNLGAGVYAEALPMALKLGMINIETIDQSLTRILLKRLQMGMFSDTATRANNPWDHIPMSVVDSHKHRAIARTLATESIVLLKNDQNVLPLLAGDSSQVLRVLVTGPNADRVETLLSNYPGCTTGPKSHVVSSCTLITPLKGLQLGAGTHRQVEFIQGVNIDDNSSTANITKVVKSAEQHDVVIFIGGYITCQENGDQCIEAEARDRATNNNPKNTPTDFGTGLPTSQLNLLHALSENTTTPLVLVVMSGSGISLPFAQMSPRVQAIVQQFYPGEEGGNALADILYGNVAPSGRMPVTVPVDESQLPTNYLDGSMSLSPGRTYRYYSGSEHEGNDALYWFGHGLGFSTFKYGKTMTISPSSIFSGNSSLEQVLSVNISVTNNGEFSSAASDHVILVFAQPMPADGATQQLASLPRRTLIGFQRVSFQPHEQKNIVLQISASRLRMVDDQDRYQILKGQYRLWVGGAKNELAAAMLNAK